MEKWKVLLSKQAQEELLQAVERHPELKPDILARLKILEDFPPEKWFFIHRHKGLNLFKAETGQWIRISGEAHFSTRTAYITHVVVTRRPS